MTTLSVYSDSVIMQEITGKNPAMDKWRLENLALNPAVKGVSFSNQRRMRQHKERDEHRCAKVS